MISDVTPVIHPATVAGGEQPAASADTSVQKAGCSKISRPGEAEVIAAARPIIIKEILKLLGKDIPSPRHHAKYLRSLAFSDLCARRDQLLRERLPMDLDLFGQPKRQRLQTQPEIFDRPDAKFDRTKKYFGAGGHR